MKTVIDAVNELKGEWPCDMLKVECPGFTCTVDQFADKVCVMMLNYGGCSELEFSHYASASKTLLTKDLDKELDVDIDWSKAPDDCVGAVESNNPYATYPFGMLVKKYDGFNGYKYCHEQEAYPCMEAFTFIPRPQPTTTYTQEMVDNGVLPSVGMECQTSTGVVTIAYKGNKLLIAIDDEGTEFQLSNKGALHALKPLTPPITLIDGKAYQFDYDGGKGIHGIYRKPNRYGFAAFTFTGGSINKKLVKNIQPLTVEVK
jgi:hypothetical protein